MISGTANVGAVWPRRTVAAGILLTWVAAGAAAADLVPTQKKIGLPEQPVHSIVPTAPGYKPDSKPFDFLNPDSSTGGVIEKPAHALPPPTPGVTPRSRRQEELLDRQKNWIFVTPETAGRREESTPEAIFNLWQSGSDGPEGRFKGALETYLEGRTGSKQSPTNAKPSALTFEDDPLQKYDRLRPLWDRDPAGRGTPISSREELFSTGKNGESSPEGDQLRGRLPADPFKSSLAPAPDLTARGWGGFENLPRRPEKTDLQKAHAEEFRLLLEGPNARAPFPGGLSDPINLLNDTSSRQVNPITGQLPSALPTVTDRRDPASPFNPLSSLDRPRGVGPAPDLNTQILGTSSLSPAILTAPPAPAPPPPTVLEIPKRKF